MKRGITANGLPVEHEPIIEQATFDQVQELMKANSVARRQKRSENGALFAGLLYDDRGNRCSVPPSNR